ncbi:MAG: TIGR04133 family radical SAM/SPASM protein [Prolixibacteraceae bacterium]|nr:TIGR04133 family radical SAM/SPASM protein [Prolixibacteraceae bacterium]
MGAKIPFRKKLALKLFIQYKKNETKLHLLNYIFWECTLRCNLNCLHCGSDCKQEPTAKEMPANDFIKTIDLLKTIVNPNKTTIVFTGGEPLVRSDIEKVGTELYKRGFPWGMVTNGYLLTPERYQSLLNAGLRSITVSLDGMEDSHNWLRGNKNSFSRALTAIKMIAETGGVEYDVVTCVNQKNIGELQHIYELLLGLKIRGWRLFTIFPAGRAKENKMLRLTSEQFKYMMEFIKRKRIEKAMPVSYGCEGFLGNYEGEVRDEFFFCRAGINVISILSDGSISACPSIRSDFAQGNIYNDNIVNVWENRFEKFRNRNWMKTGICANCNFFKYCLGNGMHLRENDSKDVTFCHLKHINLAD